MLPMLLTLLVTAIVVSLLWGDWRILVIFLGSLPFTISLMVFGLIKTGSQSLQHKKRGAAEKEEKEGVRAQAGESSTSGAIVGEVVTSIRTVAAFTAEARFLDEYTKVVEEEGLASVRGAPLWCAMLGLGQGAMLIMFGLCFWYGFWLMESDPSSVFGAPLSGCPIPEIDASRIIVPLYSMIGVLLGLGSNAQFATEATVAKAAAAEVFELIDRASLIDSASDAGVTPTEVVVGAIELRSVHFAYPTCPEFEICRGLSLHIAPGQVTAVVGRSGSGKSTLVAMLLRFYDPTEGVITLDGRSLASLNVAWLRQQMALVGQEPILFEGTIAENVAYGKAGATQEEVEEAARQANAHAFITTDLGRQYATQVGARGTQLSGGQKQRVALARALVRQAAVLLLDEATSALDNESESVVQAALDALIRTQRRTTITIAHRLSTIREAGMIACVNKGVVVETGTHDELLAMGGLYYELSNA